MTTNIYIVRTKYEGVKILALQTTQSYLLGSTFCFTYFIICENLDRGKNLVSQILCQLKGILQ